MSDAAGHLAQGPQSLLLHNGVLRLAQVVIGLLQSSIELGLVTGQGYVFAQLPEKLALRAAEGMSRASSAHQHAKDLVLNDQRRNNHGSQVSAGQSLRKGKGDRKYIRLVDQLAPDASRQTILVNRHVYALRQLKVLGNGCAARTHGADGQRLDERVMQEEAAKIDRQILLKACEHDQE